MPTDPNEAHAGGGFSSPEATSGAADYGRFVSAVRTLGDHAPAVDALNPGLP